MLVAPPWFTVVAASSAVPRSRGCTTTVLYLLVVADGAKGAKPLQGIRDGETPGVPPSFPPCSSAGRHPVTAFVVGRTALDQIMLLGGNRSNSARISAFETRWVLGYCWPKFTNPGFIQQPTFVDDQPSTSDA